MDYEKKYKEALQRARCLIQNEYTNVPVFFVSDIIEEIFPELKESEDERIRKALMQNLKERFGTKGNMGEGLDMPDVLAWLEKQGEPIDKIVKRTTTEKQRVLLTETNGDANIDWDTRSLQDVKLLLEYGLDYIKKLEEQGEQKPVDKVEPKFKVGDWLKTRHFYNETKLMRIKDLDERQYYIEDVNGNTGTPSIVYVDNNYNLWTIQDAKAGDVLYSPCCKLLWVYKDEKTCYVGSNLNYNSGSIVINKPVCIPTDVQPAAKEQRKQLEKAITEAGYMWDSESKQLLSLKAEPIDEQKPVEWSEKDEHWMQKAIDFMKHPDLIKATPTLAKDTIDWLRTLKDRVGCEVNCTTTKEWSVKKK